MGGAGGDGSSLASSPALHYRTLVAVKFISFSVIFAAVFELMGAFSGAVVFWVTAKDSQKCSVALRIWLLILTISYAVSVCMHVAMFRSLLRALDEDSPSSRRTALVTASKSTLWRVNYRGALARSIWTVAAIIFLASASACSTVTYAASPGAVTATSVFVCWHILQRLGAWLAFYLVFLRGSRQGVARRQLKTDALHYVFL